MGRQGCICRRTEYEVQGLSMFNWAGLAEWLHSPAVG